MIITIIVAYLQYYFSHFRRSDFTNSMQEKIAVFYFHSVTRFLAFRHHQCCPNRKRCDVLYGLCHCHLLSDAMADWQTEYPFLSGSSFCSIDDDHQTQWRSCTGDIWYVFCFYLAENRAEKKLSSQNSLLHKCGPSSIVFQPLSQCDNCTSRSSF